VSSLDWTPKEVSVTMEASRLLEKGKFFSPWSAVWEVVTVPKQECYGAFATVCRPKGFSDNVPQYKDILDRSDPEKRNASNETIVDSHGLPPKATKKDKTKKDKLARYTSSASSKSSKSSNKQRKSSRNLTGGSVTSSQSDQNSGKASPSLSGNSNASSRNSNASYLSQSKRFPDFGGRRPSTRAHMVPDPNSTECYRYHTVICQAVLGFYQVDVDVEKLAKGLAESDYNFLRAPHNHGHYFDKKPCWILVPACPLDKIRGWKPGDEAYPVLAVACGCGGTKVEEAYQMMCTHAYNDEDFEKDYGTEEDIGHLKRSKCKGKEFDEATQNLRQMTLAMAETLVGKDFKVRPDEILRGKLDNIDDDARNYIIKKLESKTADEEKGDEKSIGEEKRDYYEPKRHLQAPDYYDAVQFEQTRNSLKEGSKLPKANEELDLDGCELLQFDIDPKRGFDLYPDPMLLLIKAAVNWSWWCGQKLLPTCGCANEEEEELVAPSAPVPATIEFKPAPVTPDDDDDVSV